MIIYIGTILQFKGYKGEMVLGDLLSDLPKLKSGTRIKIGFSEQFAKEYTINKWTPSGRNALLTVKEINSDKQVLEVKEQGVFIDDKALKSFDKNYISAEELIGYQVYNNETNDFIGKISEIWETPANKIWLITDNNGKEFPIPVVDYIVKEINYENKTARIFALEGLIP